MFFWFQDFNPELYQSLGLCFTKQYLKDHSTLTILQSFLSMYTKGYCNIDDNQKLKQADFDVRKAYMETCVKGKIWFVFVVVVYYK